MAGEFFYLGLCDFVLCPDECECDYYEFLILDSQMKVCD
jgi:hypothetical protein